MRIYPTFLVIPWVTIACLGLFGPNPAYAASQSDEDASTNALSQVLRHFESMPKPVALPDGRLMAIFVEVKGPGIPPIEGEQEAWARYSDDNGATWSEPEPLFTLPREAGGFGYHVVLIDQDGEVHLFFLNDADTGLIRPSLDGEPLRGGSLGPNARLDIWHMKSRNGRTEWEAPKRIRKGRAGDLQSAIQLDSGRLILPISYVTDRSWRNRGDGPHAYTYMGQFDCTVLYSDDNGATWEQSPDVLHAPADDLGTYGPVEPVVVQLPDGRVWMLLRTQMGRFYESYSDEGIRWSRAEPSPIRSPDAPAGLMPLDGDRILLFWNHCQRFPYAYGGRHVLHAAVSDDNGQTWRGYREILRDPGRLKPPPSGGDFGVSYPYLVPTQDGEVLYSLWVQTGEGRSLFKFDPERLYETTQADDFSEGLEQWSAFGTKGAELRPHPEDSDAQVLAIRKAAPEWPAAAVWNFPAGATGTLTLRVRLESGFQGASIGLADHFSTPFDELAKFHNIYNVPIAADRTVADSTKPLEPGQWHTVQLQWDYKARTCTVLVDGDSVTELPMLHDSSIINYVRVRATSDKASDGALLLESVKADVSESW